jgi:hypothetical protein
MRPPICEVCDQDFPFDVEGGLLYFKETPEGREFDRRVREEAVTGHPPDAGWFCGKHYIQAKKLTHLTLSEAIQKIK